MPDKARPVALEGTYRVEKADDMQQIVGGWANVAVRKDGTEVPDAHDEPVPLAELEKAAYRFVMDYGLSGEDHRGEADAYLVQSFVFTDKSIEALLTGSDGTVNEAAANVMKASLPKGWWTEFYIPDKAAYERAKTAKTMFSIQGTADYAETVSA